MSENEREHLRDAREKLQTALNTLAGPSHTISSITRARADLVAALIHVRKALADES